MPRCLDNTALRLDVLIRRGGGMPTGKKRERRLEFRWVTYFEMYQTGTENENARPGAECEDTRRWFE